MSLEDFAQKASKVVCFGKSYQANHGNVMPDPVPEPLVFLKPNTALTANGKTVDVPRGCTGGYEVELAIVIEKEAKNVKPKDAYSYIAGYALGLDMVARNVQNYVTKNGRPWDVPKGFDTFNPIGKLIPKSEIKDPHEVDLELRINGTVRQSDSTALLVYTIPQMVAFASGVFTLYPGDVIMTGTPAGSGTFEVGDVIDAKLSYGGKVLDELKMDVRRREGGYDSSKTWQEALEA